MGEKGIGVLREVFLRHLRKREKLSPDYFRPFLRKQSPQVTLVYCSDSRVQTELWGLEATNFAFSVRNAGNQILNALGSVDYGVLHLQTPLLLIVGHVRCGAVSAALGDYGDQPPAVVKELSTLCVPLRRALRKRFKRTHDLVEEAVLENVHFQVEVALSRYRDRVEKGLLTVAGGLYDFANLYGRGRGALLLVNVNGKKDPSEVPDELKPFFVSKGWADENG
ncbi:MAG: carbonic anhydrase [Aquificae bacterium]|nr:carbonic anhydrase [Aquificota bacterium]